VRRRAAVADRFDQREGHRANDRWQSARSGVGDRSPILFRSPTQSDRTSSGAGREPGPQLIGGHCRLLIDLGEFKRRGVGRQRGFPRCCGPPFPGDAGLPTLPRTICYFPHTVDQHHRARIGAGASFAEPFAVPLCLGQRAGGDAAVGPPGASTSEYPTGRGHRDRSRPHDGTGLSHFQARHRRRSPDRKRISERRSRDLGRQQPHERETVTGESSTCEHLARVSNLYGHGCPWCQDAVRETVL